MPMEKDRYPKDWRQLAFAVKESAGWVCQICGMQCRKPGERLDTHKSTLTVHFLDHHPENCSPDNMIALCAPCHLRADAKFHAEHRKQKEQNMAIKEKISKEKFCKLVKCEENCWIFNGSNTNDFYIDDEDIIYFCNGVDTLWKFKDMPKYGEIWQSHKGLGECDSWTLWATWCAYS